MFEDLLEFKPTPEKFQRKRCNYCFQMLKLNETKLCQNCEVLKKQNLRQTLPYNRLTGLYTIVNKEIVIYDLETLLKFLQHILTEESEENERILDTIYNRGNMNKQKLEYICSRLRGLITIKREKESFSPEFVYKYLRFIPVGYLYFLYHLLSLHFFADEEKLRVEALFNGFSTQNKFLPRARNSFKRLSDYLL